MPRRLPSNSDNSEPHKPLAIVLIITIIIFIVIPAYHLLSNSQRFPYSTDYYSTYLGDTNSQYTLDINHWYVKSSLGSHHLEITLTNESTALKSWVVTIGRDGQYWFIDDIIAFSWSSSAFPFDWTRMDIQLTVNDLGIQTIDISDFYAIIRSNTSSVAFPQMRISTVAGSVGSIHLDIFFFITNSFDSILILFVPLIELLMLLIIAVGVAEERIEEKRKAYLLIAGLGITRNWAFLIPLDYANQTGSLLVTFLFSIGFASLCLYIISHFLKNNQNESRYKKFYRDYGRYLRGLLIVYFIALPIFLYFYDIAIWLLQWQVNANFIQEPAYYLVPTFFYFWKIYSDILPVIFSICLVIILIFLPLFFKRKEVVQWIRSIDC